MFESLRALPELGLAAKQKRGSRKSATPEEKQKTDYWPKFSPEFAVAAGLADLVPAVNATSGMMFPT